jgi:hypothetical protein
MLSPLTGAVRQVKTKLLLKSVLNYCSDGFFAPDSLQATNIADPPYDGTVRLRPPTGKIADGIMPATLTPSSISTTMRSGANSDGLPNGRPTVPEILAAAADLQRCFMHSLIVPSLLFQIILNFGHPGIVPSY